MEEISGSHPRRAFNKANKRIPSVLPEVRRRWSKRVGTTRTEARPPSLQIIIQKNRLAQEHVLQTILYELFSFHELRQRD